jgi:hypothetical protein
MDVLLSMFVSISHGIPGMVVSGIALLLMVLALVRKEAPMMFIAAMLIIPITFTQGDWRGLLLIIRLMPIFAFASAFFISKEEMLLAWTSPLPPFGYLLYFIFNLVALNSKGL